MAAKQFIRKACTWCLRRIMAVTGDPLGSLGRVEAAPGQNPAGRRQLLKTSSFTKGRSLPRSPGRPGRGQAFSGHGSCCCGRRGSTIGNTPGSWGALLAAAHLAASGGQGAPARSRQLADSAQRPSLSSLAWVGTKQPSGGPSPPLGGSTPSGWSGSRPLTSAGCCLVQAPAALRENALGQQRTLLVSQRTLSPFQPPP